MEKGLLIIGDHGTNGRSLDPSFDQFVDEVRKVRKKDRNVHVVSYNDVLTNNLPKIAGRTLKISLFFPFQYWNKHIEVYNADSRVYGDQKFGQEYKKFFERAKKAIKKEYRHQKIDFVNPPESCVLDRDKSAAKRLFQKHQIPSPKSFYPKSLADIQKLLAKGESLYIKPRFGSMGKGITYLNKDSLTTNFLFRKGQIVSRPYDYNWPFCKLAGQRRDSFLKILLAKDFVWEEAIDSCTIRNKRFDFRVYCIYGKIPYSYARSAPAVAPVTNWSQGGRIENKTNFSKDIPKSKLKEIHSLALKVAKRLKLNYAGVDIIYSKNFEKIYVLEAHSFPGFEKGFPLMNYLAKKEKLEL